MTPTQRKRQAKKDLLEQQKKELAMYCQIPSKFSALEVVICAAAKLDVTVSGTIHPNSQIKTLHRKLMAKRRARKSKKKATSASKSKVQKDFYSTRAWKILRYQAFEKYGNRCQCCGATPGDDVVLHIDHIKPKSTHPDLAMDLNNLQVLCAWCNIGKINQWDTDWRP